MTKRNPTKLTIYRRHCGSCPVEDSTKLDACECPLWLHGKIRGKYIRRSLDTRSLVAAIVRRDEMIAGRGDDEPTPPGGAGIHVAPKGNVSVDAAMQDFLEAKGKKATNTYDLYETAVKHFHHFMEVQNIVFLKDVDRRHVAAYLDEYAASRSANTAQGRLTHLRVFFNFCVRERRWLAHSPAASRDLNYTKKGRISKANLPFTPDEVTRILATVEQVPEADRDRTRALILLLLYSGMRISDATFIERGYIDRLNNLCYWIIKTGKELEASIELQPQVMAALAALPASRVYFFQADRDDDYRDARQALRSGGKFDRAMPDYDARIRAATALVVRVLRLAGLMGACHRFRDTFAIAMLQGGADIFTVCQFLGHSDVRVTQENYIKFVPGYRERIAQRTRVLNYSFPLAG